MTNIKFIMTLFGWTVFICLSCSSGHDKSSQVDTLKLVDKVQVQQDTSLNGVYAGLEEMCSTDSTGAKDCYNDPANPERKWYHLGYLKIRGDSVFLDQNPVSIYKKDTVFSASDGAFYYYRGTFKRNDTTILFTLDELFCDYCAQQTVVKSDGTREIVRNKKIWKGSLTAQGLIIGGNLYAKTTKEQMMMSERPPTSVDTN